MADGASNVSTDIVTDNPYLFELVPYDEATFPPLECIEEANEAVITGFRQKKWTSQESVMEFVNHPRIADCVMGSFMQRFRAYNRCDQSALLELATQCIERQDFTDALRLRFWYRPRVPKVASPPRAPDSQEAQFELPFVGTLHHLLRDHIFTMAGGDGLNHVSIIQSSGSGKSRLVHEVAKLIFSIPLNVRDPGQALLGAYPPSDKSVWMFFQTYGNEKPHCHAFLSALFHTTMQYLRALYFQSSTLTVRKLAQAWQDHLWSGNTRQKFYTEVTKEAKRLITEPQASPMDGNFSGSRLEELQTYMNTLLIPDQRGKHPQVLIYVDEADTLVKGPKRRSSDESQLPENESSPIAPQHNDTPQLADNAANEGEQNTSMSKSKLDYLTSAITDVKNVFVVFLSTQSKLSQLAPTAAEGGSARTQDPNVLQPPYVETPFDCFGTRPLLLDAIMMKDLSNPLYLSLYGRPLWRSRVAPYLSQLVARLTGQAAVGQNEATSSFAQPSTEPITFARRKLLCNHSSDLDAPSPFWTLEQKTAVLDCRIMLSIARHDTAQKFNETLVASHMRTVFSVPQSRQWINAGYPSEPFLAAAATRQTYSWRTTGIQPIETLSAVHSGGYLDRGEVGEAAARLLLTLARDLASFTENEAAALSEKIVLDPDDLWYARPIRLVTFIEALLPPDAAEALLDSVPNNVMTQTGEDVSLRHQFKDAFINFMQWSKWSDDSAGRPRALRAAFVRSTAIVCMDNAQYVDALIPIFRPQNVPDKWVWQDAVMPPDDMTAIAIQIKLRRGRGNRSELQFDGEKIGMFAGTDSNVGRQPYITLFMELDVQKSLKVNTAGAQSHGDFYFIPAAYSRDSSRNLKRNKPVPHPRYTMYVYGCSEKSYQVVQRDSTNLWTAALRPLDMFEMHPRDTYALRLKKPAFRMGAPEFEWAEEPEMRRELDTMNSDAVADERDMNDEESASDRDDDRKMQIDDL